MINVNQTEPFRQGEIAFYPVEWVKKNGLEDFKTFKMDQPKKLDMEDGKIIIGHSETGHHHVLEIERSKSAQALIDETNSLIAKIKVEGVPIELKHLRTNDTHESFKISEGEYYVRYHAQETPEGWERVID